MSIFYQRRRLKAKKMIRQIASNRNHLKQIRILFSLVLMFGMCYFSYKLLKLPQWYIDSDKLSHADKSVLILQGNNITSDYKIINIIRQSQLPNVQIFRLDTKELEENILQLQTIKKVFIRRYWFPARLSVSVDERVPAFLLAPNLESEPNSALTTDGVLIDHDYFPFKNNVKAKKLLTYGVRNGLDEVWDKKKVEELIKLTKVIETCSNQEVQYIDIRNESDIYIKIEDYLIRFGVINGNAQERAERIASILPKIKNYDKKIKYIDLRWEDSQYIRLEGEKEIKEEQSQNNNSQTENTQEETPASKQQEKPEAQENKVTVQVQDRSQEEN